MLKGTRLSLCARWCGRFDFAFISQVDAYLCKRLLNVNWFIQMISARVCGESVITDNGLYFSQSYDFSTKLLVIKVLNNKYRWRFSIRKFSSWRW